MRLRPVFLTVLATGALALGGVMPALAGPLDDAPDTHESIDVQEVVGYIVELPGTGTPEVEVDGIPVAAVINDLYEPLDGPVRNQQGGAADTLLDMLVVADVQVSELVSVSDNRLAKLGEFVNQQCGDCLPGLGGPIGPIPIGPVGDEARSVVNGGISTLNSTYAVVGARANQLCGHCLPGLGGPIGPIPIGPVGDPTG